MGGGPEGTRSTDEQARTIFLALVLTGIRRGEIQSLRWRDVDLLEGVLRGAVESSTDLSSSEPI